MPRNVIRTQNVVKLAGAKIIPNQLSSEIDNQDAEVTLRSYNDRVRELREETQNIERKNKILLETLVAKAKDDAAKLIEEASRRGESLLEGKIAETDMVRDELDSKAERIIADAEEKAKKTLELTQQKAEKMVSEAHQKGYDEGLAQGLAKGESDSVQIVEQLHVMLNKVIERRNDMVEELEEQIVDIILLMVRKVVKVMSERQQSVVIANIKHALARLKRQVDVILRVNIKDLNIANEHKEKILKFNSQIKRLTIVEDTTVDPGGCIVETDYGKVDARVRTQLEEIEKQVHALNPVNTSK